MIQDILDALVSDEWFVCWINTHTTETFQEYVEQIVMARLAATNVTSCSAQIIDLNYVNYSWAGPR